MKLKRLSIIIMFLFFFFIEIAITFSFKSESNRNSITTDIVPLSHKLTNELSIDTNMADVDSIFMSFLRKNDIKGASVAITNKGKLVYAKGFGYSDYENQIKAEPYNLFRIASVSKLITAVAVMKLVEDGQIKLNDKVFGKNGILNDSRYLDYKDSRIEKITIYQLLNHTAGWSSKYADPLFRSLSVAKLMGIEPPADEEVIIQFSLKKGLQYYPGTKYSYSNLGYCILGEIIEEVTGMGYEEYVQFAILHPLGIYDMHIGKSFETEQLPNEVKYYDNGSITECYPFDGSKELVPVVYGGNNIELLGSAGGWVASAPELARFMVAIDGFSSRPDILSERTINKMTIKGLGKKSYIGWRGTDGNGSWWRTGTLAGTTALLMRTSDEINYVVILNTSTRRKTRTHNEISRTMFNALHTVDNWPDKDLFSNQSLDKKFKASL